MSERVVIDIFAGTAPPVALSDAVLRLIWAEERISRAEIARSLGLSRSTVTEIVKELLETPFVREIGEGESSGGRRPIVLEFQNEARVILGCEIGATHVSVLLTDMQGRRLGWHDQPFPVRDNPQGTVDLVIDTANRLLETVPGGKKTLLSMGVAVPSPIQSEDPDILSDVIIPSWTGFTGFALLSDYFGVPVHVDNDANLGALAETWWGVGSSAKDFVFIKYGYGIGAGYILDGQVYRGHRGSAGEFGHIPINPMGAECVCGLRGCLVTEIGGKALVDQATCRLHEAPSSLLNNAPVTLSSIEAAALEGDDFAISLLTDAFDKLGLALAGWVNLMNPEMIVIGGSLSKTGDLMIRRIRAVLDRCSLITSAPRVTIRTSELGPHVISIGAATLALKRALSEPSFTIPSALQD